MSGASGGWQEPVRSILGNVLASMSPETERRGLEEQERLGGPLSRVISKGLLETLRAPMNEFSMGPSALMTRPQVYKKIIEEFGEGINRSDLAKVLKTFPGTVTERLKGISMLDEQTLKSYGFGSNPPLGGYYSPAEPPTKIIASLPGKGFQKVEKDPLRLTSYKGDPGIFLGKEIDEPIQALSHELTHEMLERLGYTYPSSMSYKANPHEILATIMEQYPTDKSLTAILNKLQTKGKDVWTAKEASKWVTTLEEMLKKMENPPKSKMSEYLKRRAREKKWK